MAGGGGDGGGARGGVDGGGDAGGGKGGPTVVVTVLSADSLTPRLEAIVEGARASLWAVLALCADAPDAEPSLITVTSASTAFTVTSGTMALTDTPKLDATTLVSTAGGARLPPLVASSSRVTVNSALLLCRTRCRRFI